MFPTDDLACEQSMSHPAADPTGFQRAFETLSDGFVTPTVVGEGQISGCVYRNDGSKVKLSERFGGWNGDIFKSVNPDRLDRPHCIERSGKGIYLGPFMAGHYGHFITEGLSTFWIFEQKPAEQFDYFLFSPFVFGTDIPEYALQCLRAFGIDPRKIVIMGDDALSFEEIIVPERLFRLNHSADPSLRWVYQELCRKVAAAGKSPEKIYVSRRHLSLKKLTRVIANEVLVEKLFAQAGFTIVYPEELSFSAQLNLFTRVVVLAGSSGSALHNSLFMNRGAKLIELGDPRHGGSRAPTQMSCDLISGVDHALIPFVGKLRADGGASSLAIESLHKSLMDVLNKMEKGSSARELQPVKARFMEFFEIIYLTYRPALVNRLRQGIRRLTSLKQTSVEA